MKSGRASAPRREATRELLFVAFELTNPRNRCVTIPERRWSLPLAVGEFCWHAAASDKVDFISYYAKRWSDFSDDGVSIAGSCYGHKIFSAQADGESQWSAVTNLLRTDPESRRAILTFQNVGGPYLSGRDVACATSLQFLVRAGALHAVVNMRSNDAVWGLPYDLFVFTMLQELMAATLGLNLGSYHHVAASLHIYERHFRLAERVIQAQETGSRPMPPMSDVSQLSSFLACEEQLRLGLGRGLEHGLAPYWASMAQILVEHRDTISSR